MEKSETSIQNIKNRFYGTNDPVANKILKIASEKKVSDERKYVWFPTGKRTVSCGWLLTGPGQLHFAFRCACCRADKSAAAETVGPVKAGSAGGPPKNLPLPGEGPASYPSQDPRQLGAAYKKSEIARD